MVDWVKKQIIPRADLIAWHHHVPGESANNIAYDYSGADRYIFCTAGAGAPVIQANLLNGQSGWYFDGTKDPLARSVSVTPKHIFILAAANEATFATYRGLLSGVTTGDILVGDSGTNKFYNLYGGSSMVYKKSGVQHDLNAMLAPMSGNFELIEVSWVDGFPSNGIQVGQQKGDTSRKFKGWWIDQQLYSTVQGELPVERIYRYYAMRYQVWQKSTSGLYVFPFAANRTRSEERDREHYLSEPYDGDPKALVRGGFEGRYSLPFMLREQEEFIAAKAFFDQHYPLGKFVFRDYRYYPYKEITGRFASPFREQGSDVTYRFNYSFDIAETT
ncbi:MAG: hypothetical protein ABI539_15235 [Acidobacteriota bacterium]